MKAKSLFAAGAALFMALLSPPPVNATVSTLISTLPSNGGLRTGDGFTLGGIFTVGSSSIMVTALGVYDTSGNGLTTATSVGIWSGSGTGDSLLVSATVPTGTSAGLLNGFRYVTLGTPVTLLAGQSYTIGAFYSNSDTDQLFDHGSNAALDSHLSAFAAGFSPTNTATGLTEPSGRTTNAFYIGPNFQFTIVPEPSTLALLASSSVIAAGYLGRRRR